MASISDQQVTIRCGCGRNVRARLRDFQNGRTVRCSMGHTIRLKEQGSGIRQADQALRRFEQEMKRISRRRR